MCAFSSLDRKLILFMFYLMVKSSELLSKRELSEGPRVSPRECRDTDKLVLKQISFKKVTFTSPPFLTNLTSSMINR